MNFINQEWFCDYRMMLRYFYTSSKIFLLICGILNVVISKPTSDTNDSPKTADLADGSGDGEYLDFFDFIKKLKSQQTNESGNENVEYEVFFEYPEGSNGNETEDAQHLIDYLELIQLISSPGEFIVVDESGDIIKAHENPPDDKSNNLDPIKQTEENEHIKKDRPKRSLKVDNSDGLFTKSGRRGKYINFVNQPQVPSTNEKDTLNLDDINQDDMVGILDESGYFNVIPNSKFLNPFDRRNRFRVAEIDDYPSYLEYDEYPDIVSGPSSGFLDLEGDYESDSGYKNNDLDNSQFIIIAEPLDEQIDDSDNIVEIPINRDDLQKLESYRTTSDGRKSEDNGNYQHEKPKQLVTRTPTSSGVLRQPSKLENIHLLNKATSTSADNLVGQIENKDKQKPQKEKAIQNKDKENSPVTSKLPQIRSENLDAAEADRKLIRKQNKDSFVIPKLPVFSKNPALNPPNPPNEPSKVPAGAELANQNDQKVKQADGKKKPRKPKRKTPAIQQNQGKQRSKVNTNKKE